MILIVYENIAYLKILDYVKNLLTGRVNIYELLGKKGMLRG